MKLSLAVIAKDEYDDIHRIITQYSDYFDEIAIAIDDDKYYKILDKEFKKDKKVKFYKYTWIDDFAHKRNWLTEKLTGDYYVRIDTDDAIKSPEKLREVAYRAFTNNIGIVYCLYDYSKDDWGNVNAQHYRETIIKNCDNYYWNKPIHENVLPKDTKDHNIFLDEEIRIEHLATPKHLEESYMRNVRYLLDEYKRDGDNTDPRTIAYLGRMLFAIGEHDRALHFLELHIKNSGWDEDRYTSWCQIAEIMRQKKEYKVAIGAAMEALDERPDYPEAYFKLHDVYQEQEQWDKAIFWGTEGLKKPIPKALTLLDPSAYSWRPALSLSFCYLQKGDFIQAKKLFDIAEKAAPTLDFIKKQKAVYEMGYEHTMYMKHLMWIVQFLNAKDKTKIKPLIESIPNELHEHEVVSSLKNTFLEPKTWGEKEISIYCGVGGEQWTPDIVKTGVGGSEEAVIYMSQELTKLGYKVTVYNTCGDKEGDYVGVKYLNSHRFNPNDNHNIVISWRVNVFPWVEKAKKKILWIHDIPLNIRWTNETVEKIDKVIVLSDYHKSLLPPIVPKEKIFVSTNGILPKDFEHLSTDKRENKRIIYASSYNRGLEKILRNWKTIKKEVPDAKLDIYYGWQVYDTFVKDGTIRDDGWKSEMTKLMQQDGITEHGRIGHKELLKEYCKAGVYAYPCTYSGEINCIALTKAIACGCDIITNDFAVMKERSPNAVSDDVFIDKLIEKLKDPKPKDIDKEYIKSMSWEAVAKDWDKKLFNEKV